MKISAAFAVLNLDSKASPADVSVSFRRLLKQYHPDKNSQKTEWSHKMTVQLNEAYETVTAYLNKKSTAQPTQKTSHPKTDFNPVLHHHFRILCDLVLDQLFSYYIYGLEKLHLRSSGIFRYKYRNIKKQITKLILQLQQTKPLYGTSSQHAQLSALEHFAIGIQENMNIQPQNHAELVGEERKIYLYYRESSVALDNAIKSEFFRRHFSVYSPGSIDVCEKNLIKLFAHYPDCRWISNAIIKFYYLQGFKNLQKHL